MTISKLFSSLEGSWSFVRNIVNEGTIVGRATFTRISPHQLHYREDGEFRRVNGVSTIFREYVYSCQNETISVFFNEKPLRLFHTLQFRPPLSYPFVATATHWCPPDHYNSSYHFLNSNEFHISHTITGPKKQILMNTIFTKV